MKRTILTRRDGLRLVGWLAALAAVVALVAACGGADNAAVDAAPDETAATDAPEVAPEPSVSPSDGADDDADDDGDAPERLADYLGGLGFGLGFGVDPEEMQAYYARQAQQAEELIAQCMANEGFEYIPAVQPIPDAVFGGPNDMEYAREWGFGVTTAYLYEESPFGAADDWTDPNEAIVEAMSDSERQAYYDALHSPPAPTGTETDPETGETVEVYDDSFGEGCSGEAYEEVYGGQELMEVLDALDLESMWERMQADPRTREVFGDWSECMADRGYDYDDPDEMYEQVYDEFWTRLEEIVGPGGGFVDPFEGLSSDEIDELLSNLSEDEFEDFFASAQLEARQQVDQAALSALQDEERDLAVANAECSQDMVQELDELSKEYEADLIEANRALLEDYREQQGG